MLPILTMAKFESSVIQDSSLTTNIEYMRNSKFESSVIQDSSLTKLFQKV